MSNRQVQNTTVMTLPAYRPDIDGLRGVAVLMVVGYHAFPAWVAGGFIGVDVFFVISGYLITSLILANLENGDFKFIAFYGRRIRRLFPALVLVLVACFAVGWLVLLPDEYKQLGKHIASGAGFVPNFVYANEAGYFDNAAETKPLLHLWSLGIEEQFYLVWPLLLWFAWKVGLSVLAITVLLIAISFTANAWGADNVPVTAFYSPGMRIWELLLGSLLAYMTLYRQDAIRRIDQRISAVLAAVMRKDASRNDGLREVKAALGLLLVVVPVLLYSKSSAFPGWRALLPTAGSFLIISAGSGAWLNHRLLANRFFVNLGLISFPLYLWHWPLLSFANIVEGATPSREARIAAVLASIVLAWFTYRVVERPVRFGKQGKTKVAVLSVLMLGIGLVGYATYAYDGVRSRIGSDPNSRELRLWGFGGPSRGVTHCTNKAEDLSSSFCAQLGRRPRVALLGDSHAGHLFWGLTNSGDERFGHVIAMGAGSCQPTLDVESRQGCNKQLRKALTRLEKMPDVEVVVVAAYYGDIPPARMNAFADGYARTFGHLRGLGKKVIFVVDPPTLRTDPEVCLPHRPLHIKFPEYFPRPEFCRGAKSGDLMERIEYEEFVDRLITNHPEVFFYQPESVLCEDGTCKVFHEERLLYGDKNHLSIYGSELLMKDLVSRYKAHERSRSSGFARN